MFRTVICSSLFFCVVVVVVLMMPELQTPTSIDF